MEKRMTDTLMNAATHRQLLVLIVAACCDICNREALDREAYQLRLNELLAERGVDPVALETLETL